MRATTHALTIGARARVRRADREDSERLEDQAPRNLLLMGDR